MKRTVLLFLLLAAAFDFLFWEQTPALNVFFFSLLVVGALYLKFKDARNRVVVGILALGSIVSGFMVFVHGAGWALAANVMSLLFFAVAVSNLQLHSFCYFIPQSLLNLVLVPVTMGHKLTLVSKKENSDRKFVFHLFVVVVPILIAAFFYAMYLWGSPHFRQANSALLESIEAYFGERPVLHLFFLLWGILMGGYFLFPGFFSLPAESNSKFLIRTRKPKTGIANMALKRELLAGTVVLLLLNGLIAVVNYIDIKTVWFDFIVPENFSLKQFVHNGTWILFVCVLMSVVIILWLFRGNQNHFWKSWLLRLLAYTWIVQNIVLAFSVFMRNYHYIGWHGLAYGRIFVIVLMLVTLAALIILMLKVARKFTGHYFLSLNSWIAYGLVITCSLVNWDKVIVNYNLAHANPAQIDYSFYLRVSGDLYPTLFENRDRIDNQIAAHEKNKERWVNWTESEFRKCLRYKRSKYFREIVFRDWRSLTLNDYLEFDRLRALNGK